MGSRKAGEWLRIYWQEFRSVVINEFKSIVSDEGVLLVLVIAPVLYATLYSYAYHNEVVRNVPIAVVDDSQTGSSRKLVDLFDAMPNTFVAYEAEGMEEAKRLFFSRNVYGIVYIPESYEKDLLSGVQTTVPLYVDGSYFLLYRQVFQEIVTALTATGTMVEYQRLVANGINVPQARTVSQPVLYQSHNLFNPYLGYGTYVMPAILIVLIQQTLLIGVGMIGGTWREFGLYERLRPAGCKRMSTLPIVAGKTAVYMSLYAVTMTYIFWGHYHMFGYPMNGRPLTVAIFLASYLFASIFLGILLSTLFRYREQSILFLLWTSIPVLLVSGVSYPRQAIPEWLYTLGKIFPSSSAIDGFIRIQDMGASLYDVLPELKVLWSQIIVYGGFACIAIHFTMHRDHAVRIRERIKGRLQRIKA